MIKIEDPAAGGDVGRSVPPGAKQMAAVSTSRRSIGVNAASRSTSRTLPDGRSFSAWSPQPTRSTTIFAAICPERLGLTYAALCDINPAIVCVSLSAYGREDARRAEPGYDALVQAEAGWASLTGEPDAPPARSGLPLADYAAGLDGRLWPAGGGARCPPHRPRPRRRRVPLRHRAGHAQLSGHLVVVGGDRTR